MDLAFGGDLEDFVPKGTGPGKRGDGRDLTKTWASRPGARYVTDAASLTALDSNGGPVLGLFAPGDLPSPVDKVEHANVPTLTEMTTKAIDILAAKKTGYFLLVESASIDKWHHANNAYRALTDVDELSKAVQAAMDKTDPNDTLIIVTADHSHGLVISAGSSREEPITGLVRNHGTNLTDGNNQPRLTLTYATGPGGPKGGVAAPVPDEAAATSPDFHQPALVYMASAQHAGEDVPVYARGPDSDLLTGTFESSYIYQVMAHAFFAGGQ